MADRVVNYDFENPFGSGMNPLSGGSGVLEQIQEQVSNNGDVLRSMQGGIGGLPSGNLPPGVAEFFKKNLGGIQYHQSTGGIGGGIVNRSDGPGGDIKSPTLGGGSTPAPPSTPPMMTEPQDPIPDFRSMITDRYRREGVDDGFFDSEFYLNTFDGGGMSGIFGGPEGQVAAMSKYFGSGGSNSGRRDESYENYLRATGQEDKIKTGQDYMGGNIFNLNPIQGNASAVGDGIFDVNGVQGTINATAPIQGNEPIDPGRNPSFYDPRGIPNDEDRIQYGNVGNTRLAGPLDQYGVAQDPSIGKDLFNIRAPVGMDQLFGRAFAGKPV